MSDTDETELLQANHELFHAIAARDLTTLERLLAPDFRYDQRGQAGDRAAFFAALAAQTAVVESITNEELRLRLDGDQAIVSGRQRAQVLYQGQRLVDEVPFHDRWRRRDGRWQVTFAGDPPAGAAR